MLALRRHSCGLPGGPASSPPPSAHPFSPKGGTREPRPAGADARACVAVLTWDGAVSAVSRDAVRDSAVARSATVLDDWDDAFDRGKVRRGPSPRRAAGWGRSREDAASLGSVVQWPRTSHPVQALTVNVVWPPARQWRPVASVGTAGTSAGGLSSGSVGPAGQGGSRPHAGPGGPFREL